jgi:hypothetical protein
VAIPESQLDTWSKTGAAAQSRDTYGTIKKVLEDSASPYSVKSFESFLQGSYGNDTNVYRDSDVDIVMRLDSTFYHNAHLLPREQYEAFQRAFPTSAQYEVTHFKAEVLSWLSQKFNGVKSGSKAIFIPGSGNRRDCDVLACAHYRYYRRFYSLTDDDRVDGIYFYLNDGTQIVNFPKQHSANCTAKHKETFEWFKPTVRIYKNIRNHLVDKKLLRDGAAPSYFIEGMLWNVPPDKFGTNYTTTFLDTLVYLTAADRSTFRCANGIHPLLANGSPISWSPADCQLFLDAVVKLWTSWC